MELFKQFFDDETIMDQFVRETNSYAWNTNIRRWNDVDREELFKFCIPSVRSKLGTTLTLLKMQKTPSGRLNLR